MFASHLAFKIINLTYLFTFILIFNTTFNVLLIHFAKFGGDPMKKDPWKTSWCLSYWVCPNHSQLGLQSYPNSGQDCFNGYKYVSTTLFKRSTTRGLTPISRQMAQFPNKKVPNCSENDLIFLPHLYLSYAHIFYFDVSHSVGPAHFFFFHYH